eukprot:4103127-Alexandrium_andersonii.AAC.1
MPVRGGCRGSAETHGHLPARPTRCCPATPAARAILPNRKSTARPGPLTRVYAFSGLAAYTAPIDAVLRAAC